MKYEHAVLFLMDPRNIPNLHVDSTLSLSLKNTDLGKIRGISFDKSTPPLSKEYYMGNPFRLWSFHYLKSWSQRISSAHQ